MVRTTSGAQRAEAERPCVAPAHSTHYFTATIEGKKFPLTHLLNAESDTLGSRDYYAWQHAAIRGVGAHLLIVDESDNIHCSGDKTKVFGENINLKD